MVPYLLLVFFFTLALSPVLCSSELSLESGYTVSTLIDFNKHSSLHPFSLLPLHNSQHLLLLDSTNSSFYSLPLSLSQESKISPFSGKGGAGFADGDGKDAMFNKPRNFAVDGRDNVYVADRLNGAIRKITPSGLATTIAGGYSKREGHIDGAAQNASFSNDFDVVYVPTLCALLISDRGNRLIRQLQLKPEDCLHKAQAGLGAVPVSAIAVLCLLVGLVIGFVAQPLIARREISANRFISKTWKHYPTNLGRVALTAYSGIRSAIANSSIYDQMLRFVNIGLCYLSIVFRNIRLERRGQSGSKRIPFKVRSVCRKPDSLLDSDAVTEHYMQKPQDFADQLQDLISFNEGTSALMVNSSSEQQYETEDALGGSGCKIEDMISANLSDFSNQPKQQGQIYVFEAYNPGLVQRRPMKGVAL